MLSHILIFLLVLYWLQPQYGYTALCSWQATAQIKSDIANSQRRNAFFGLYVKWSTLFKFHLVSAIYPPVACILWIYHLAAYASPQTIRSLHPFLFILISHFLHIFLKLDKARIEVGLSRAVRFIKNTNRTGKKLIYGDQGKFHTLYEVHRTQIIIIQ